MPDADHPRWMRLTAIDAVVELQLHGARAAEIEPLVRDAWSRCLITEPDPSGTTTPAAVVRLTLDDAPDVVDAARDEDGLAGSDPETLLHLLSPVVTRRAIEHQAGRLLMLHAAALADPATGRSIALVAPSGTGKTTACLQLGTRLGYVTDETVAIRDDLTIAPYPKPLSVVRAATHVKAQQSPDTVGLLPAPETPRLAALAILSRDGSAPHAEAVSTVRAMAALAPESSFLARMDRPLHHLADVLDAVGGLRVLHYAEAGDLAPLITELLGTTS